MVVTPLLVEDLPWSPPADYFGWLCREPRLVFLDSAAVGDARSKVSYLCFDPVCTLRSRNGEVTVDEVVVAGDPFDLVRRELAAKAGDAAAPLPFSGGAVGYFGYEMGRALERLSSRHGDGDMPDPPDMVIGIYDTVIGFRHETEQAWLMLRDRAGMDTRARAGAIRARLAAAGGAGRDARRDVRRDVRRGDRDEAPVWRADFDWNFYRRAVERLLEYIRAGDVFQANFTLRHSAARPAGLDTVAWYRALRQLSPAPFASYLDCGGGLTLLSASPERFLSLDAAGRIEARPIKGTRPRHADPARDRELAAALAASGKDRAENLMIVDLLRNDIGRVAEIGSVAVPEFCTVESFATVHHLVSSVVGRLRPGLDAIDLLRAALPAGSVTGAPKIRAMQIIDELETCRRGPYCGVIAWLGFDGAMDSSVVIRTLVATPTQVFAQAGGGIVADSDPAAEYEEMLVKVAPLLAVADG